MARPETGVMQFYNDWPGAFVRGDDAFGYAAAIRRVLRVVEQIGTTKSISEEEARDLLRPYLHDAKMLQDLADLLAAPATPREDIQVLHEFDECARGHDA